jgi:prophage antirepressor-like protein
MSTQSNDNTNLTVFNFKDQEVRTLKIDGSILFVNADVSIVLDIDPTQARRLDDDEKGLYTIQTLGGPQQMLCVTESGLYHLIFTSRKEEAKIFRRWVTGEVLRQYPQNRHLLSA